jgi:tetratricopeptide (TPR) repeat protein
VTAQRRCVALAISACLAVVKGGLVRAQDVQQEVLQPDSSRPKPGAEPVQLPAEDDDAYALFLEGRALIEEGRMAEACIRLKRSLELAQTVGTLLNLGLCEFRQARLVSAHGYYKRAEENAARIHDTERLGLARRELAELEQRAGTVTVSAVDRTQADLVLLVDDQPLERDRWGLPLMLDSGPHAISARAPGRRSWREMITMQDGQHRVLVVPALMPDNALPPPVRSSALQQASADSTRSPGDVQYTAALLGCGVGLAALGFMVAFAVQAHSDFDDSTRYCTKFDVCFGEGLSLRRSAKAQSMRADVAAGIGAGMLLGALSLWLTLPSKRTVSGPRIGLTAEVGTAQLWLARSL